MGLILVKGIFISSQILHSSLTIQLVNTVVVLYSRMDNNHDDVIRVIVSALALCCKLRV